MWVGFHDDPILRYDADRQAAMKPRRRRTTRRSCGRSSPGPTLLRRSPRTPRTRSTLPTASTTSTTSSATRRRTTPRSCSRSGARRSGRTATRAATTCRHRWPTFQNFAKAVATRYSGRTAGYPFVRFFGIWNESNLGLFLSPQFNSKGAIVSPAAYAKLAAAGYAGIKAGNAKALVAIGETSSSGRDKPKVGRERRSRRRDVRPDASRRRTRS